MSERRLIKELNQYKKNPPSLSNHQIKSLNPINDDDLFHWNAVISKPTQQDNPWYYNGQWNLDITIPHDYPLSPPTIKFISPICHPNINIITGEICLDILKKDSWSPAWNLQYLLVAILMLLDHPEPDSPLNIDSANLFKFDKIAYESLVQYFIWKFDTFFIVEDDLSASMIRSVSGLKDEDEFNQESVISLNSRIHDTIHEIESEAQDIHDDLSTLHISEDVKDAVHQIESEATDIVNDIPKTKSTSSIPSSQSYQNLVSAKDNDKPESNERIKLKPTTKIKKLIKRKVQS